MKTNQQLLKLRTPGLSLVGVVLVLLATRFMPSGKIGELGVPPSVLFTSAVNGLVVGVFAIGVVLVYRTLRVINFAGTILGASGALFSTELAYLTPVPFPIAVLLGLLVGVVIGVAFDLVFGRRFFRAPRLILTFFTIVAGATLNGIAVGGVLGLPFFPPLSRRSVTSEIGGGDIFTSHLPFPNFVFHIGKVSPPFGFGYVFAIGLCLATMLTVYVFLQRTRLGTALRAMSENMDRTSTLGISTGLLSSVIWGLTGGITASAVLASSLVTSPLAATNFDPVLLGLVISAAVIGQMESFTIAVAAAIGLSLLLGSLAFSYPNQPALVPVVSFLAVTIGLLFRGRRGGRSERADESWQGNEEIRPVPTEMRSVALVRVFRYVVPALIALLAVAYPFLVDAGHVSFGGVVLIDCIVGLSIVVLTGWGGQASLGQFGLAAIGAVLAGALTDHLGFSFWLSVPLAVLFTAVFAALLGVPSLRVKGLFLLVSTFSFAAMVRAVLFDPKYFGWLLPGPVHRPTLFVIDFEDEKSMYYLCLAAFVLSATAVLNLRRSRFGRLLIAVRENEANTQSAGVSPTRIKIIAFTFAGALSGFAGALFTFHQRGVSPESFNPISSLAIFQQVVVGGATSISGAVLGLILFAALGQVFSSDAILSAVFSSSAVLVILYLSPGGMMQILVRLRDAVLRIEAQRNQLIVPSLFADMDPEALRRRLIPLARASVTSGVGVLKSRYRLNTALYRRDGMFSAEAARVDQGSEALGRAAGTARDQEQALAGEANVAV